MATYADANLNQIPRAPQSPQRDPEVEITELFDLLHTQGWNAVDLNVAMRVLNRPKATAARRLAEARTRYAAELTRRARNGIPNRSGR